jgi:sec-independent protein translocase protein TatC
MPEPETDPLDPTSMTLGEHLDELRLRILRALIGLGGATAAMLAFTGRLIGVLKRPYEQAVADAGLEANLTVVNVTAGFTTYMRVAILAGLILSAPWVFYQLWMFVAAGLYPKEKKAVLAAVPFSALLFVAGALTFLYGLSYPTLYFFVRFNAWLGLQPIVTLEHHIAFMTNLMLIFGICFQLPVVLYILAWTGLVSAKTMGKYRRHAVVVILIIAALATSPSPVDQVGLAIPMYLLYELGVQLSRLAERKRAASTEPTDRE